MISNRDWRAVHMGVHMGVGGGASPKKAPIMEKKVAERPPHGKKGHHNSKNVSYKGPHIFQGGATDYSCPPPPSQGKIRFAI